jgi:hypothetical protein
MDYIGTFFKADGDAAAVSPVGLGIFYGSLVEYDGGFVELYSRNGKNQKMIPE